MVSRNGFSAKAFMFHTYQTKNKMDNRWGKPLPAILIH
jgi:hypothetical protein